MNDRVARLRLFLKIAEMGSLTAAARALSLSQPALSRSLADFERELGTRLFDRHTRKLVLTPAGMQLRGLGVRVMSEIERGFASFDDFLQSREGQITIAVLPSVAAVLFPAAIAKFRTQHPTILIRVRDGSQNPVLDDVLSGRAHFGLTMDPTRDEEFSFVPLLTDELVFVAARRSADRWPARLRWDVFGDKPFIALTQGSSIRRMTDAAFEQGGITVVPNQECGYPETVISLALAGLGVTALPRLTLSDALAPALVIRPLSGPVVGRRIGIVTRAGQSLPPSVDRLLAMLRTEAANYRRLRTRNG